MKSNLDTLPVFPLGVVLYPGIPLDLQIFEPRYIDLVKNSVRDQAPFAIAPILEGREVGVVPKIFPWGTLVSIIDWSQRENGLLGITVQGNQRVRLGATRIAENNLMLAKAEVFSTEVNVAIEDEDVDLLAFLNQLIEQTGGKTRHTQEKMSLNSLVWQLAYMLPIDRDCKCELLTLEDPRERASNLKRRLWEMSQKH